MGRVDALIACREALTDIRQIDQEIAIIRAGKDAIRPKVINELLGHMDAERNQARRRYLMLIGDAFSALDGLRDSHRKILLMYYLMGYVLQQIADDLYYSLGNVQLQKRKALDILKRMDEEERAI